MLKSIVWGIIGIAGYGIFVLAVSPMGDIKGLNVGVFSAMLITWVTVALYIVIMRTIRRR